MMTWIPHKWGDGWRRYGVTREDPRQCAAAVGSRGRARDHQCQNPRGHGPGGEFCRKHAEWLQRRTLREVGE